MNSNLQFKEYFSPEFKSWVELEYGIPFNEVVEQVGIGLVNLYQISKQTVKDKVFQHCAPNPVLNMKKFIHKKSGKIYTLLCITNTTATKSGYDEVAVYMNENNEIFSRPIAEFVDKFAES